MAKHEEEMSIERSNTSAFPLKQDSNSRGKSSDGFWKRFLKGARNFFRRSKGSGDPDGFWRILLKSWKHIFDWKSCSTRYEFWTILPGICFFYVLSFLIPDFFRIVSFFMKIQMRTIIFIASIACLPLAFCCVLNYAALVARRLNDIGAPSVTKYIWGIFWISVIVSYPFRTAAGIYAAVILGILLFYFCMAAFVKGKTGHPISKFRYVKSIAASLALFFLTFMGLSGILSYNYPHVEIIFKIIFPYLHFCDQHYLTTYMSEDGVYHAVGPGLFGNCDIYF